MIRVLPRDLFNDANLLKCVGAIILAIEDRKLPPVFTYVYDGDPFDIEQDENDGSTYICNVVISASNNELNLRRPLNSREAWPLFASLWDGDECEVFNSDGSFSDAFLALGVAA